MSDISPAQLAANRANGALSLGPVTPEGKRRSSLGALRHGLTSRIAVMPWEDLGQYKAFSAQYVASLQPQDPIETGLAQTAADLQWRLQRVRSYEESVFAQQLSEEDTSNFSVEQESPRPEGEAPIPDSGASQSSLPSPESVAFTLAAGRAFIQKSQHLLNLSLYEHRIYNGLQKALKDLKLRQQERVSAEKDKADAEKQKAEAPMEEAILLYNLHKTEGTPFDPSEYGFVFSAPQIEYAAWRRARLGAARMAPKLPPIAPKSPIAPQNPLQKAAK